MISMPGTPRLVLASASPRRLHLLRDAGYLFDVDPAHINESDHPSGLSPGELAEYLALQKAQAVMRRHPGDVVLAADTVVALGKLVLGKPDDAADAGRMLELLGGSTHQVITGVAVMHAGASNAVAARVSSQVSMRPLRDDEIKRYVASNEWQGKAGGYGIQDPDPFVTCTSGSLTNIVGLPMDETRQLLAAAGIEPAEAQVG
jgi:septum formation protein